MKKILTFIWYVLSVVLMAILILGAPFILMLLWLSTYGIAIIGAAIFWTYFFKYSFSMKLTEPTLLYLTLTTSAVIITQFGNKINSLLLKHHEFTEKLKGLSFSIHSENNARIGIFILYLLLIIITTFYGLFDTNAFYEKKLDYAVIQSFATYIAFDRVKSNIKLSNLKGGLKDITANLIQYVKSIFPMH